MPTAKAMDRIVPFLEKDVPHTQDYGRLVDVLMDAGQFEKARQCCIEGFGKTCKESRASPLDCTSAFAAWRSRPVCRSWPQPIWPTPSSNSRILPD
ncbi:MAG: hypothetical protein KUA37_05435 [Desulfomicrobium sp.]|nr:hypothetical protein [Pseudomonadota bacterium]MBV1711434.1 hypothetical protein [Desulfomicrobium sp.]MBU4570836.1 hypothetical protein [Pseudomonadota bacterium]MBU4595326.1 hypothetical protein [Pseudomonadota bacterium]MBV1720758.1 hypothetical protein [Desulfomicrobium sp.]